MMTKLAQARAGALHLARLFVGDVTNLHISSRSAANAAAMSFQ
jgi:hypothetical protein